MLIKVFLPDETVRRMDETRGLVTRSAFVRHFVQQGLGQDERLIGGPVAPLEPSRRRPKLRDGGGGGR